MSYWLSGKEQSENGDCIFGKGAMLSAKLHRILRKSDETVKHIGDIADKLVETGDLESGKRAALMTELHGISEMRDDLHKRVGKLDKRMEDMIYTMSMNENSKPCEIALASARLYRTVRENADITKRIEEMKKAHQLELTEMRTKHAQEMGKARKGVRTQRS